eukprot:gene26189-34807_t
MKLQIALDWTPNSNHTGFYVALEKGWYSTAGLEVELLPPSEDYSDDETPARSIISGRATLCVAPTESTSDKDIRPVAIATLLQNDTSAIATKATANIKSMADLDGKTYASYGGRFEMAILRQMIKNAGGKGDVVEVLPPKLDCFFKSVAKGSVDSTWVFLGWEGIAAELDGLELKNFPLSDAGVPYGYSPVLLAHPDLLSTPEKRDQLKTFLAITERGYIFALDEPAAAAECLIRVSQHPSVTSEFGRQLMLKSQEFHSRGCYYLDASNRWGRMDPARWTAFVDWLFAHDLISDRSGQTLPRSAVDVGSLFTNELLLS